MQQKLELQPQQDGTGPLFHRRYSILFAHPDLSPERVIARVKQAFEASEAVLLTEIEKPSGRPGIMALGDVYEFKMLGLLSAKVRVAGVSDTAFCFETLQGHPQAGQIRFSAVRVGPNQLRLRVESWARSRDALIQFVYEDMGIGKKLQTQIWTKFCRYMVHECGGQALGKVRIKTKTIPAHTRPFMKQ